MNTIKFQQIKKIVKTTLVNCHQKNFNKNSYTFSDVIWQLAYLDLSFIASSLRVRIHEQQACLLSVYKTSGIESNDCHDRPIGNLWKLKLESRDHRSTLSITFLIYPLLSTIWYFN